MGFLERIGPLIFLAVWVSLLLWSISSAWNKYTQKEKQKEYMANVISNLNSNSATELMSFIQKNGCSNYPEQWNQLMGAWNAINNCPLITTEDKIKLRDFLMVKGLRLTGYDKNINDNYGKHQREKATH